MQDVIEVQDDLLDELEEEVESPVVSYIRPQC